MPELPECLSKNFEHFKTAYEYQAEAMFRVKYYYQFCVFFIVV